MERKMGLSEVPKGKNVIVQTSGASFDYSGAVDIETNGASFDYPGAEQEFPAPNNIIKPSAPCI